MLLALSFAPACGQKSSLTGANDSEVKGGRESGGAPPIGTVTLSAEDSKFVVNALKDAQVKPTSTGGSSFPVYEWLQPLHCTKSSMELVAPGGGGFIRREMKSCYFGEDNSVKEVQNETIVGNMIKILGTYNFKPVVRGGAFPVSTWTIKALKCTESTMELIGRDHFTTRTMYNCVATR